MTPAKRTRLRLTSKRNRHNGHVNAMKKMIIEKSERPVRIRGRIYCYKQMSPNKFGNSYTVVRLT